MKVTEYAVRRRIATAVITFALVVLGIYSFVFLPVNFLPDIIYPMIKVHIWWRGATPEEININIADPLEQQMAMVDNLDYLESSSIEGMYTLLVNFKYGVDVNVAYQDALEAMARVARKLPKDMDPPMIFKADPSQLPVVQITISSDRWDLTKLRTWTDNWLQYQLQAVSGVAGVDIVGGLKREIRVHLDPNAVEKYNLTLPGVLKRIEEENLEQFGGRVTTGRREVIARTMGEYQSLDDICNVVLASTEAGKIYLKDVAQVEDAHEEVRVITRLGGQPAVKLSVLKQEDANTVEVARAVSQRIEELKPVIPVGVRLGMVENQADYVIAAVNGVRNAAIEAAVLVIIIIYLFLGSWRHVLVLLLALPITLILNFALMKLGYFSLNIFSLGGLVVAIGVVLDNSIVVLENITRLRQENPQEDSASLAEQGTHEVWVPILASTLSSLALLLPFLLVPGLTSLLFRELILVVAGVFLLSLALAVTLTPMLTSIIMGRPRANRHHGEGRFARFFDRVKEAYTSLLRLTLRFRKPVFAGFIVVLLGAVVLFPWLGSEFLPRIDDGRVMVKVKLPTGAALTETDQLLARVEEKLQGDPLVESYLTMAGGKIWGLATYEIANEGQVDIQLVPRHARKLSTKEYVAQLKKKLAGVSIPGAKPMVMQPPVKGIRKLGEADIEVKIKGQELGQLFDLAREVSESMHKLAHFTNVYVSMDLTKPEYQVLVDRTRAAELGVSVVDVASAVRTFISGQVATRYREGDYFYNIRVMIPEQHFTSKQEVENLVVYCAQKGYLRLKDIARVIPAVGPVEIAREDQVKEVIVRGDASGVSVGQALSRLKEAVSTIRLPVGYEISYGGQAQMMTDMQRSVIIILAFALFFAFVVHAVEFNSLRLPGLILGSVPFSLAGSVYILFLTGFPVGATVIIGVLIVVAATINEGVLLITFADDLHRERQLSPVEAVIEAAKIRLRPRLMIALAVIFGFIPLALNLEEGGEMLQPMAVGGIGGLALGVFVALFLCPILYVMFTRTDKPEEARKGQEDSIPGKS
jgi:hydrophobe/amphiphile efflux-1 (HAE1) family protein